MVVGNAQRWRLLGRWSPAHFLFAGALLTGHAALLSYEAVTNSPAPEDLFGPPGFLLAMIGVLGLYPAVRTRAPRHARAGALAAAVAVPGWFVVSAFAVAEVAGVLPPLEHLGALGDVVIVAAGGSMILAYVLIGVAYLRTDAHRRTLGLLLLAPPAVFGVMLVQGALFVGFGLFSEATMAWSAVAISWGQATAHPAIGHVLLTERNAVDRETPSADATPG